MTKHLRRSGSEPFGSREARRGDNLFGNGVRSTQVALHVRGAPPAKRPVPSPPHHSLE